MPAIIETVASGDVVRELTSTLPGGSLERGDNSTITATTATPITTTGKSC